MSGSGKKDKKKDEKGYFWNKLFKSNTVDDEALSNLLDMGYEYEVAKRNLIRKTTTITVNPIRPIPMSRV